MIKVDILGQSWKVFCLSEEKYVKQVGDDSIGCTFKDSRCIYFNENELNHELIAHETVHAYYASLCVYSATLSPEQVEEVFCDLFGTHHDRILGTVYEIEKKLL